MSEMQLLVNKMLDEICPTSDDLVACLSMDELIAQVRVIESKLGITYASIRGYALVWWHTRMAMVEQAWADLVNRPVER